MPEKISRLPMIYCVPVFTPSISFIEHRVTPKMAIKKLTQRRLFIFSFNKTTASKAETTGKVRLMMEPLLAVDCCVPNVINTCAGNWPTNASKRNIFKSLSFLFLFALTSLYTNGSIKIVASSMGINTVLKAPTWPCTNLMQVNCNDHIRLQANKAAQDNKGFFILITDKIIYNVLLAGLKLKSTKPIFLLQNILIIIH